MQFNWSMLLVAGVVPLIIGNIWYHPSVFGKAWMREAGLSQEKMMVKSMWKMILLTLVLGLVLAVGVLPSSIHQMHMMSVFEGDPSLKDPNSESSLYIKHFFEQYGTRFRTFKHGAFHGLLQAIFVVLPIVSLMSLHERRSFKYVMIQVGYFAVCFMLMFGVLSQWM